MKKEKNSLLLNVLLERELVDISISSGRFQKIVKAGSLNVKEFDDSFKIVDATGLSILPPFLPSVITWSVGSKAQRK